MRYSKWSAAQLSVEHKRTIHWRQTTEIVRRQIDHLTNSIRAVKEGIKHWPVSSFPHPSTNSSNKTHITPSIAAPPETGPELIPAAKNSHTICIQYPLLC